MLLHKLGQEIITLKEFDHIQFTGQHKYVCRDYGTSPVKRMTSPARPVQNQAHHHINVHTDIKNDGQ